MKNGIYFRIFAIIIEVIQNFESTQPYDIAPKGKLSTVWGVLKAK